jgi:hypothetical protein
MINHDNYKAMCEYLRYETEVFVLDDATLERHESMLKHVLRWLDGMPLNDAPRHSQYAPSSLSRRERRRR